MRIETVTVRACPIAVEPTIILAAHLVFPTGLEVPACVVGTILSDDGKALGMFSGVGESRVLLALDAGAQSAREGKHAIEMRCVLTPRVLDKIRARRDQDKKGDVHLRVSVNVTLIRARVYNATFKLGPATSTSSGRSPSPVLYDQPGERPFYTDVGNLWVLSGANGKTFLEQETVQQEIVASIRSSDWVHDFESVFHATRYLIVNVAVSEARLETAGLSKDKFEAAVAALAKAANSFDHGEWTDVMTDLRPVWELVRNDTILADVLRRDGYSDEAAANLNDSVRSLYDLGSKFVHRLGLDKKTVIPEIHASREDATLCYTFAAAVLNLITRKVSRLDRPASGNVP